MTEAATTNNGTAASQSAEGAAATTAETTAGQQATGATNDGTSAAEGSTGDKGAEGAPESYEFSMPEGVQMPEEGVKAFSEFAKEQGLTQDAAQNLLSKLAPAMQARQAQQVEQIRTEWTASAKSDKEFGGDKLNENLAVAKTALDKFGTPELRTLLNESGLGNHPEIIRAFYRAGKAVSEDGFVASGGAGKPAPKSFNDVAASLYPSS